MTARVQKMVLGTAAMLCLGYGVAAVAQDGPPPPPQQGDMQGPPPGRGGPGGRGGERMVERVIHELNMSPEQAASFKAIMADQRAKMETLRGDGAGPGGNRKAMMDIHRDADAKIHALLTNDQKAKYDAMEERMRERMRENREGRPDGPPPPPPPPSM
jgi:protein CpxP